MRVFFIGARIVGYNTIQALLENGINVVGALFLDDIRAKNTVAHKNFDDLISKYTLNAKTFTSFKKEDYAMWMQQLNIDIGIVIGVSNLIPPSMLEIPKMGFIGMHPTLLPVGRGRAPIPWTLIKDLKQSGTTLFICEAGADTGLVLAQKSYPVHYQDTCLSLGRRSDEAVIELLLEVLPKYFNKTLQPIQQDESKATYWGKRNPDDGLIDWNKSSREIYNWIRALTRPYPGAFSFIDEKKIMVWASQEYDSTTPGKPGEIIRILPDGLLVGTGSGNILLTEIEGLDSIGFKEGTSFQN